MELERLNVILELRHREYMATLGQAQAATNRQLAAIETRYATMATKVRSSASAAAIGVTGALGSITTLLGIHALSDYADAWTRVTRALDATSQIFGVTLIDAEALAAMATRTRSDIEALSKLYVRASDAVQRYGGTQQDAAAAVETYAKSLKLGQASATEARAATEQFAQSLAKGFINGDELRSQMELAAIVVHALAEQLGVTKGELIKLGEQGKISAQHMINAMLKIKPVVDREFGRMPTTVDEAFTNLRTALIKYVGQANEARGVTAAIASSLQGIANSMDSVADTAAILGAALLATFGGRTLGSVTAIAARLASLPAIIAGSVVAVETMGDQVGFNFDLMKQAADQGADWGTALGVGMRDAANSGVTLQDQFHGLFAVMSEDLLGAINQITAALGGQEVDWNDIAVAALFSIGAIVGGVKGLYHLFLASFSALPLLAQSAFIEADNGIRRAMQSLLDFFAESVNNIIAIANKIPKVEIDFVVAPDLGQVENTATARLRQISADVTRQLQRDFDLGAYADRINDKAKQFSLERQTADWARGTEIQKGSGGKGGTDTGGKADSKLSEFERGVRQIEKRTAALQAQNTVIGQSTREAERAAAMQELLSDAQRSGLQITPALYAQMDRLARAYGEVSAQAEVLQAINRTRHETEDLENEIRLTGLYGAELERARIQQQLLTEAKRAGARLTAEQEREIELLAEKNAQLKQMQQIIADTRDTSREALSGFIKNMRDGVSATEALGNALNRISDRLIDMGINGLVEAALGPIFNPAAGGSSSGALGKLLGFADGGVMTPQGPRALQRFAGGGVSTKAAIFGEAGPEAAVPLPDGRRIPVELRMPRIPVANASGGLPAVTVVANFTLENATPGTIDKAQTEMIPKLRQLVRSEVGQLFDRKARFARSGL